MSSMFGALIEEITWTKRLLDHPEYNGDHHIAGDLAARAERLQKEAAQVCEWLHSLAGLIEAEPGEPAASA